ncbi:MAG TPA: LytTR family DNA-binding domain-containing protein [Gammaproteobacteria bacterium]|jgi:two-component system LytT family response regulator
MIRVLVVEDEPHARDKLRELLEQEPDLELVGLCGDGLQALSDIGSLQPDVVFLDIQIPGLDGQELVRALGRSVSPRIVVTTAYSDHAVWAFEIEAVDYLLKPYDRPRLRVALQRLRTVLGRVGADGKRPEAPVPPATPSGAVERRGDMLKMKVGNRIKFITMGKVRYIQAQGDYIQVNTVDEEFQVRERIKDVVGQLDPDSFLRVHRSVLLNINYIREMKPWLHGDYEFTMRDGTVFHSSASYRQQVRAALGPG